MLSTMPHVNFLLLKITTKSHVLSQKYHISAPKYQTLQITIVAITNMQLGVFVVCFEGTLCACQFHTLNKNIIYKNRGYIATWHFVIS